MSEIVEKYHKDKNDYFYSVLNKLLTFCKGEDKYDSPIPLMKSLDLPQPLKSRLISRVTGNVRDRGFREYYGYLDDIWKAIDELESITIEDLERLDSEYEIPAWGASGLRLVPPHIMKKLREVWESCDPKLVDLKMKLEANQKFWDTKHTLPNPLSIEYLEQLANAFSDEQDNLNTNKEQE